MSDQQCGAVGVPGVLPGIFLPENKKNLKFCFAYQNKIYICNVIVEH